MPPFRKTSFVSAANRKTRLVALLIDESRWMAVPMWRSVPAIICLERELRGCCAVSAKLFAEGCGPDPFQNTAHSTGSGSRDRKPSGPWIADKAQNWLVVSGQINVGGHCMKKAYVKPSVTSLGLLRSITRMVLSRCLGVTIE